MANLPRYEVTIDSGQTWIGRIPRHWEVSPIKRRYDVVGGSTPKSENEGFWNGDIVWVTPSDLSQVSRMYIHDSARRITMDGLESCGTTLVPSGSVILSTRAPIGSVAISAKALCINQGCKVLVPKASEHAKFLAYALLAAKAELNNRGSGTTFLELSGAELAGFRLAFPPVPEQHAITDFLDRETANIDLLIAKQEHLIDLLTEKRQSVFTKLFTQGAKKDVDVKGSGVGWLGVIPSHWKVVPIGALASFISYGFTNPMPTADEGPYMLTANDIGDGKIGLSSARKTTEDAYAKLTAKSRPILNDVLITKDGTLGRVALHSGEKVCINQSVALVRFKPEMVLPAFAANALRGGLYQARMVFEAGGTTIKHIYISRLSKMPLAVPPLDEQLEILKNLEQETGAIESLMKKSFRAIELLREHRASLISAAVTGKIRITEDVKTSEKMALA